MQRRASYIPGKIGFPSLSQVIWISESEATRTSKWTGSPSCTVIPPSNAESKRGGSPTLMFPNGEVAESGAVETAVDISPRRQLALILGCLDALVGA